VPARVRGERTLVRQQGLCAGTVEVWLRRGLFRRRQLSSSFCDAGGADFFWELGELHHFTRRAVAVRPDLAAPRPKGKLSSGPTKNRSDCREFRHAMRAPITITRRQTGTDIVGKPEFASRFARLADVAFARCALLSTSNFGHCTLRQAAPEPQKAERSWRHELGGSGSHGLGSEFSRRFRGWSSGGGDRRSERVASDVENGCASVSGALGSAWPSGWQPRVCWRQRFDRVMPSDARRQPRRPERRRGFRSVVNVDLRDILRVRRRKRASRRGP